MKFFILIPTVVFFAWLVIWLRLIKPAELPRKWNIILGSVLVITFFLEIGAPILLRSNFATSPLRQNFLTSVFAFLGFIDILLFFTLLKDFFLIPFKVFAASRIDGNRRLFIMRGVNLAAFGVAGISTAVGTKIALEGPKIKRVDIPINGLHPDLEGLRIVQISDIHVGALIERPYVEKIVEMVNSLNPHFIALTGDLADGKVGDLLEATTPLRNLKASLGKFYVTGNHEYYWGVDEWTKYVQELGFNYLFNEHKIIKVKSSKILFGGVPDYSCERIRPDHKSDPVKSLRNSPESDLKILLAHQPKSCFLAYEAGYDIQLSGHTHNGQFFPNNLIMRLFHPYVKGLNLHRNKLSVYVNSGTGYWGPPQRLGIPSEISCLRLIKG